MLEIRLAETAEEREQVFKLRYQVYIEELGWCYPDADHKYRRMEDTLDISANIFIAWELGQVVGTVRCNYVRNSNLESYLNLYKMHEFVEDAYLDSSISTRFMIKKEFRGTTLAKRLIIAKHKQKLIDKIKFDFIDVPPHMTPFYQRLGYQIIGAINYPGYGEWPVMVLDVLNY
jgi:predicted GNAT family N-acyltransferase